MNGFKYIVQKMLVMGQGTNLVHICDPSIS